MGWLAVPFIVAAGLCWVSAVVHWIASLRHLSGRLAVGAMLFRGSEAFRRENYTPRGQLFQRRFIVSFLGFVASAILTVIVGIVASRVGGP